MLRLLCQIVSAFYHTVPLYTLYILAFSFPLIGKFGRLLSIRPNAVGFSNGTAGILRELSWLGRSRLYQGAFDFGDNPLYSKHSSKPPAKEGLGEGYLISGSNQDILLS